jgi:hypothetical protein
MCNECAAERDAVDSDEIARSDNASVRFYHCAPPMRWFGDRECGIGVELEVDVENCNMETHLQRALNRIDRIAGDRVYFEHDGSLNAGFEIITHPHTLEAFRDIPWGEIMDACLENGFQSHDAGTCGLHVHFSREMFGDNEDTQDDNIAKLIQFFEMYWDDMVRASRRTGEQLQWCNRHGDINKNRLKEYVKDKRGSHSVAINNANAHTVEIRVMRGTLNLRSFYACINLLVTLVKNVCRLDWGDISDDVAMLEGIDPETIDYLLRNAAFYHAANQLRFR